MSIRKIIALAAFTYLFLAPFTYHPDIKTIFYQSQYLSHGVFNIYAFFAENKSLAFLGPFVYPPFAYFIFGILFIPVRLLGGAGFVEWLGMGNDAVGVPHIFQYLFAIKLPAIAVHFATALVITRFFQGETLQRKALLVWFFNPVSIYVVAFMGQIDGFAVLLTIISLYYASKKPYLSSILLGIGGAVKTYPLLLIPYLSFIAGKNWRNKVGLLITGFFSYALFIIPYLTTPSFYESTLVSGLSQRIFELRFPLGFGENLIVLPLIFVFFVILSLSISYGRLNNLKGFFLAVTILLITGTHFHPQWALWSLPFIAVTVVGNFKNYKDEILISSILFFFGFLGTIVLFEDRFLTWGVISPLDPGTLFLPPPVDLLRKFTDPLLLQSLFHTLMAASGIWLVMRSFRYEKSE